MLYPLSYEGGSSGLWRVSEIFQAWTPGRDRARPPAMLFATIAQQTSIRIAEVGFALVAIAGGLVFLAVFLPGPRRPLVATAGALLAGGAVLVIIATHWGTFGYPAVPLR